MGSAVSYYDSVSGIQEFIDQEQLTNPPSPKNITPLAPKRIHAQPPQSPRDSTTSSSKVYLEPIQNLFPAEANLSHATKTVSQQQCLRKYKFTPSPRSAMKKSTDTVPFAADNKQKIQLPPINISEIPRLLVEEPESSSSNIINLPSLTVHTPPPCPRPVPKQNQNQAACGLFVSSCVSVVSSLDVEEPCQSQLHSLDKIDSPAHESVNINELKRKKLDEYIEMKQCNAYEEMFRLQQFQFPVSNKLVMY